LNSAGSSASVSGETRGVHKHVYRAERRCELGRDRRMRRTVGQRNAQAPVACPGQLGAQRRRAVGPGVEADDDGRTFAGQRTHAGGTDAAAAAGDDRGLALQSRNARRAGGGHGTVSEVRSRRIVF
jgi:hypothetical protein